MNDSKSEQEPLRRTVRIVNYRGLHARAAAAFVRLAETFQADILVWRDGTERVCGTSIMGLMLLVAGPGEDIHIGAVGPDAADALEALCGLVSSGFGEED